MVLSKQVNHNTTEYVFRQQYWSCVVD